jgi:outer membrane protein
MKTKLNLLLLFAVLLGASSGISFAKDKDDNDWIIRTRAVRVTTDGNSKVSTLGGGVATTSDLVPEIDFTRFFTPNIAAELIVATTHHDVSLKGSSLGDKKELGSVNLLPPTLTAQYHFNPKGTFRPYAGAGLNYTFFYGAKTGGISTSMKYKNHMGYALQTGFDYMINDKISINFDIKKIFLRTKVQVNDAYTAKVGLDPWLIGAGIGYHF